MRAFLKFEFFAVALAGLIALQIPALADETKQQLASSASHGFSPLHSLKYGRDFRHFDYVNPTAPKGGDIRVSAIGTFNSLNFLKYPGQTPMRRSGLMSGFSNYLFDSLLVASNDEIAGYYGLLAKSVTVEPNYRWVRFKLNPSAKWSDGKSVTAEDVVFTIETLKKQGTPYYRQVLRPITVDANSDDEVTFKTERPGDRSIVQVVGSIPIHPKHYWDKRDVSKTSLDIPLGSGPYKVSKVSAGRSVHLRRDENYWAKDHPVNQGRYNFDAITLEFFRNQTAALEAFKAGDIDVRLESSAVSWAKKYTGPGITSGDIKKVALKTTGRGTSASLVFNQRRSLLQDIRVRKALARVYDFESINFKLHQGLYKPVRSRYGNTVLAAKGEADSREQDLLAPFKTTVNPVLFDKPAPDWRADTTVLREDFVAASKLLDEAGLKLVDGKRINPTTGEPVILDVIVRNPANERVLALYANNLKKLGIGLYYPSLEPVSAHKKIYAHDYDLTFYSWSGDLEAGRSEYLIWSSVKPGRDRAYALAGASDPALDAVILAMNKAKTIEKLQAATRVFDRLIRWRVYDIPLWRSDEIWLVYWDKFDRPTNLAGAVSVIDSWWAKRATKKQSRIGAEGRTVDQPL